MQERLLILNIERRATGSDAELFALHSSGKLPSEAVKEARQRLMNSRDSAIARVINR